MNHIQNNNPQFESSTFSQIVKNYFFTLKSVLFSPREFFKTLSLSGGITVPMTYAIVTHWISQALGHFFGSMLGTASSFYWTKLFNTMQLKYDLSEFTNKLWFDQAQSLIMNWFLGLGAVIVDPFFTAAKIIIQAAFILIGAQLCFKRESLISLNFESIVRVICYGMTPFIFISIPFLGSFIASIYVFVVTLIGIEIAFNVTTPRALLALFLPKLILLAIVMGIFLVFFLVFIKTMGVF